MSTMGDVGVQGSDINGQHDGVGRETGGEGLYDIEEMVGILSKVICSYNAY